MNLELEETDRFQEANRLYERYAQLARLAEEAALRDLGEDDSTSREHPSFDRPLGLVIRTD